LIKDETTVADIPTTEPAVKKDDDAILPASTPAEPKQKPSSIA